MVRDGALAAIRCRGGHFGDGTSGGIEPSGRCPGRSRIWPQFGGHGTFAGGRRHGNDTYIKAASDERDKLLMTKLKASAAAAEN